MGVRGRIALLVAATLVVGLLGPCLCGPTTAADTAATSHGCCDGKLVLQRASLDCCPGCSAPLPTLDSDLVRAGSPGVVFAPATCVNTLVPRSSVGSFASPLRPFAVPAPPTVLRV